LTLPAGYTIILQNVKEKRQGWEAVTVGGMPREDVEGANVRDPGGEVVPELRR